MMNTRSTRNAGYLGIWINFTKTDSNHPAVQRLERLSNWILYIVGVVNYGIADPQDYIIW